MYASCPSRFLFASTASIVFNTAGLEKKRDHAALDLVSSETELEFGTI